MIAVFDTNIVIDALNAIIWATAQVHSTVLVTRNTKDFNPGWQGIRLPYTIP